MALLELSTHPTTPQTSLQSLTAALDWIPDGDLSLSYRLEGELDRLSIPDRQINPRRCDGLWQHFCLELFIRRRSDPVYWEFNFSPSGDWALYRFEAYRRGMLAERVQRPPQPRTSLQHKHLRLDVNIDIQQIGIGRTDSLDIGCSAVIVSNQGDTSYWALAHPSATPDFHHPESFFPLSATQRSI